MLAALENMNTRRYGRETDSITEAHAWLFCDFHQIRLKRCEPELKCTLERLGRACGGGPLPEGDWERCIESLTRVWEVQ